MRRSIASVSVSARALTMALVVPGALLAFAAPAQAQFGRLKKLGGEIAREAGREAAGLPPKKTDSSPSSGSASKESADYTITAERLDVVMTALAPLAEAARGEAAAKEVEAAFKAKRGKWEACITDAGKRMTAMSDAYLNGGAGPLGERSAAAMQRMANAMQAGRKRETAFLQDTVGVITLEMSALMSGAKCGPSVYTPAAVIEANLAREAESGGEIDESGRRVGQVVVPESARTGLTTRQFGMLRERIAMYAIALAGDGSEASLKSFTDAERSALGARAAELRGIAPFFRDGLIRWSTWGDLKSW